MPSTTEIKKLYNNKSIINTSALTIGREIFHQKHINVQMNPQLLKLFFRYLEDRLAGTGLKEEFCNVRAIRAF